MPIFNTLHNSCIIQPGMESLLSIRLNLFLLLIISFTSAGASALPPSLSGPSTGTVGSQSTYVYNNGMTHPDFTWYVPVMGVKVSESQSGTAYTVVIQWTTTGTGTLEAAYDIDIILPQGTMSITISEAPPATPNTTFTTIQNCDGTATISRNSEPPAGYTWYWQTSSTGTATNLGSGSSFTISSSTSVYLRARSNATSSWSSGSQSAGTVTPNPVVGNPGVSSTSRCGPGTLTFNGTAGANSTTLRWYDASTGGNLLATALSYTTPSLSSGTTYYVSSYNSSTGCESARLSVSATIKPMPSAPDFTLENNICGSGWAQATAPPGAGGYDVNWYNASTSGTLLFTGYQFNTPTLTTTTTYYLATISLNGCESSPRVPMTVNVYPVPGAPAATGGARCGPGTVTLNATPISGVEIRWYDTQDNYITSGTSYSPNVSSTTNYRVKGMNANGCVSTSYTTVTATVNPIPGTPSMSSGSRCGPGTVNLSGSTGTNGTTLRWYDAGSGGNLLATSLSYTTPSISSNTSYWASSYNSTTGCEGSRVSVTATIKSLPSAPAYTLENNICGSGWAQATAPPGAGGYDVSWYDHPTLLTPLFTGYQFNTPTLHTTTTYYLATISTNGCESSPRVPMTVNVYPVPGAPAATGAARCSPGVVTLNATPEAGMEIRWYIMPQDDYVASGTTYSPNVPSTTNFRVRNMNANGCISASYTTATATVDPIPGYPLPPPIASTTGSRCDPGSVTLSATPASPADGIKWFTSHVAGAEVHDQPEFITPEISSGVYYFAASYNSSDGCVSESRIPVRANIEPKPKTLLIGSTPVFGSGTATLSVDYLFSERKKQAQFETITDTTELQVRWFSNEANAIANTPVLAKGIVYTTPPITQTTNYYARIHDKTTGCLGEPTLAVANVIPFIASQSIQTDVIRVAGKKDEAALNSLTDTERSTVITYMDGVGRVHQQVVMRGSPTGKDIIQPVDFDNLGRASKTYLPYVGTTTDGSFHSGHHVEQAAFYQASNDKIANDTHPFSISVYEDSPLGRVIEQSGVGQAWQPGSGHTSKVVYGFNTGATSDEAEEVRRFNPNGTSTGFYAANILSRVESMDADGNKMITFNDPQGKVIVTKQQLDEIVDGVTVSYLETYYIYDDFGRITFIITPKGTKELRSGASFASIKDNLCHSFVYDRRGRLIEKKVPGQAALYYIYDDLNRLVLTQDGLQRATNRWIFYKYDQKGRNVMHGIYHNTTQTSRFLMQDLVDNLYTDSNPTYPVNAWHESRGTTVMGYSNISFPQTDSDNSELEIWNVNYYDNYDFDNNGTDDFAYTSQGLSGEHTQGLTAGLPTGSKRRVMGTSNFLVSYTFYDDRGRVIQTRSNHHLDLPKVDNLVTNIYDFEGKMNTSRTFTNRAPDILNRCEYDKDGRLTSVYGPSPLTESVQWTSETNVTINGSTITKTSGANTTWNAGAVSVNSLAANEDGWVEFRAGETNTNKMAGLAAYNTGVNYPTITFALYASAGTLQVYESGVPTGGISVAYSINDVLSVERKSGKIYYRKNNQLLYTSTITNTGQLYVDCAIHTTNGSVKNVNLFRSGEIRLVKYEYNELGQLVDKKLHNTTGEDFLQSMDYRYNIRGQLTSINNSSITNDGTLNDDTNDLFGMELMYNTEDNTLGNTPYYNGNISAMKWKGPGIASGADDRRSYKYVYDKANWLEAATSQMFSGSAWNKESNAYNESMSYDHNGNITTLQRNQRQYQPDFTYASQQIDNLTYTYESTIGDRLKKVEDTSGQAGGFNNQSAAATEYTYDVQGNTLTDLNKGITTNITYNHMGKPTQIALGGGRTIQYVYDGAGNKLTMRNILNGVTQLTTDYIGGFVFEGGNASGPLKYYGSPEGRVVMNGTAPEYQYSIADHQGNTRLVFSSAQPVAKTPSTVFESDPGTLNNFPTGGNLNTLQLFNRTASGTKSQLLSGGNNSQVGVGKSFAVYPGDKVKIQAYAKYEAGGSSPSSGFATALLQAFTLSAPGVGETGTPSAALNAWGGLIDNGAQDGGTAPEAFVNIVVFDKDYNLLDAAWDQISEDAEQVGVSPDIDHDEMIMEYMIKEAGFVYLYVSNNSPVNVYFDDVTITHTPTNVVQYNEYYPFGLQASTSWTRENNKNDFKYNAGSELSNTSGWYEMFYRNYDPALGRMMQVDPYATAYSSLTPYNYAINNPAYFNDPNGDQAEAPLGVSQSAWRRIQYRDDPSGYSTEWSESFNAYTESLGGFSTSDPAVIAAILGVAQQGGEISWSTGTVYTTISYAGIDYSTMAAATEYSPATGATIITGEIRVGAGDPPDKWGTTKAALGLSLLLLADDVTGVGVVDDIAIPAILIGAIAWDLVKPDVRENVIMPARGFKGGKQSERDRDYGLPKELLDWWHNGGGKKQNGGQDIGFGEGQLSPGEALEQWEGLGKPLGPKSKFK